MPTSFPCRWAYNVSSTESCQTTRKFLERWSTSVFCLFVFPKLTQSNGKGFNLNMYLAGSGLNSTEWFPCMYVLWAASGVGGGLCVGRNTLRDKARCCYLPKGTEGRLSCQYTMTELVPLMIHLQNLRILVLEDT